MKSKTSRRAAAPEPDRRRFGETKPVRGSPDPTAISAEQTHRWRNIGYHMPPATGWGRRLAKSQRGGFLQQRPQILAERGGTGRQHAAAPRR